MYAAMSSICFAYWLAIALLKSITLAATSNKLSQWSQNIVGAPCHALHWRKQVPRERYNIVNKIPARFKLALAIQITHCMSLNFIVATSQKISTAVSWNAYSKQSYLIKWNDCANGNSLSGDRDRSGHEPGTAILRGLGYERSPTITTVAGRIQSTDAAPSERREGDSRVYSPSE